MLDNNPLRQYFRRPALYLKLPSGGTGYPAGAIDMPENGELPIYPMSAIDEITSRTPDALFNGVAVTEIIKSCVPSIKRPWEILNIDLDPILVAIKIATNGQLMEIDSTCPEFKEDSKFDVSLSGLLGTFTPGDYDTPVTIGELKIKFRPLTYREVSKANEKQFDIQRALVEIDRIEDVDVKNTKTSELISSINNLTTELLIETIEYIKTPDATVLDKEFINEFLQHCDKNTHNFIKEKNIELRKTTELKPLDITCSHCSHKHQQALNINITDFFD
jgi:hypothetical protein